MASLTDVLSVTQNGVIAFNNFSKQMAGSLLNISGQLLNISGQLIANSSAIGLLQTPHYGLVNSGGSLGVSLSSITNALGADVALNNVANYFDGPSVSQGSSGTWFASGTVMFTDTAGPARIYGRLWDGTTVIAAGTQFVSAATAEMSLSLSGYLASPAANIRISVRDISSTSGKMIFNTTGTGKDSIISAIRIA